MNKTSGQQGINTRTNGAATATQAQQQQVSAATNAAPPFFL